MRYINAPNVAYGEDRRTYKVGVSGVESTDTVFNVSYDNGRVEAYLNGVRLYPGDDFTKTSSGIGTNITLASAIGASNVLEIVGYQGINSGNALVEDNFVVGTGSTGSGGSYTNSTTVFPVASSAGDTVSVLRNGVKLVPTTDYTVQASASKVTLLSAASSDDEITVQVVGGVIHNNGLTVNSGSNSFFLPTNRGSDNYVLTRDDTAGTGGTTWKETLSIPTITGIKYSNQTSGTFAENSGQTATDPAGGDLCQISGTNFDSTQATPADLNNVAISIDGTSATSISVNSGKTEVTFTAPAKSAGSYTLTATNGSGLSATTTISYDATPTWVTGANADLGDFADGSITGTNGPQIIASEDGSNLTTGYKQVTSNSDNTIITSGIAGLTVGDNGYLTGTLAGTNGATNTFYAVAHDNENQQSAIRQFHFISYDYPGDGGTIVEPASYTGDYRSHTFLSGTTPFTLYSATTVDILCVAGGGAGTKGTHGGSGGGAGGMLVKTSHSMPAGTYSIVVGVGGTGGTGVGDDGDDSTITQTSGSGFTTLTATGGGGGAIHSANGTANRIGRDGGSGGGGAETYQDPGAGDNAGGGTGDGTVGTDGNTAGYYGGNGGTGTQQFGGAGGGGASENGGNSVASNVGGNGGDGLQNNFRTGSNVYYAGGGGGNGDTGGGAGGDGGGGTAAGGGANSDAGDANTGGGGSGAGNTGGNTGGDGGSGIVVIRYAT